MLLQKFYKSRPRLEHGNQERGSKIGMRTKGKVLNVELSTALFLLTMTIPISAAAGETGSAAHAGRLASCPATPNCVSSQSLDPARHLPPLLVAGEPTQAMAALRQLLLEHKRTTLVMQADDYLHAEVRSAVFRFVDDVEFLLACDARLHFRSAAQTGYWDLGVNRRRMIRIRTMLMRRFGSIFKEDRQ
jgi:uncharacterized protein (DUF1499 family)